MNKRTSRRRFITLAIVVVIGILLSVLKFDIPYTDTTYNGFIRAIPLGLDFRGGVSAVYEASLPADNISADLDSAVDATIVRLQALLEGEGYKESNVSKQGDNKIRVEVAKVTDTEDLFELLGEPANLKFTKKNSPNADAVMTGKHIKNATVGYQDGDGDGVSDYGVVLSFTEEGTRLFADLTEEVAESGETIYIFINDEQVSALNASGSITGGSTFISGDNMNTYDTANKFAMKILSGSFNTNLKLIENSNVSASLGRNALKYCSIAICAVIVLFMILFFILYGEMGLISNFATVMWAVLFLFFLQSVPLVQLTISGFAGIMLATLLIFVAHSLILEKIKEEYALGKKIPMSFKSACKKSRIILADIHAVIFITSLVLYFAGSAGAKSFSIVLAIGTVISLFISMVVTPWLLKCYLPLNSTRAKKLRLKREVSVNEL